ncbi:MAG: cache domain-containing protein, partial [Thermodesulfobacteriota bacterium]
EMRLDLLRSVAVLAAAAPAVQQAVARGDRESLITLYQPVFERLSRLEGVNLLHFHQYPAKSLLRLHRLDMYGGEMSRYRPSIMAAYEQGEVVGGVEFGLTGFALRAVAPIQFEGRTVGSVEAGYNLDRAFLNELKEKLGGELTIILPAPHLPLGFRPLASTLDEPILPAPAAYQAALEGRQSFLVLKSGRQDLALLVGPINNFQGQPAAVIEIVRDRAGILGLVKQYAYHIAIFGLIILTLALVFVWLVSTLFLAPIAGLVQQAEKITTGEQVPLLEITHRDEFGALAAALNKMLAKLEESRRRIENHAHELEARVQERTAELVVSEEKFRALVENIPLVVYRVEKDLVRTFVSPHIERIIGVPAEEEVGPPGVWAGRVHPEDQARVLAAYRGCLDQAESFDLEYRLLDLQGQEVEVLDHGEPVLGDGDEVRHLEGYLLDIRERKRYEAQAAQAEELRTLTDISARLAHEFRNPLSMVGLSARRLAKILAETGPETRHAHILIEQVGRLEQILNMILTYIRPIAPRPVLIDPNELLGQTAERGRSFLQDKALEFTLDISPGLPRLKIDAELMDRALLNLLKNAVFQMPARGTLAMTAGREGRTVVIRLIYPAGYLPDDKLRHFFYPFTTEEADASLMDLSLVPVIVHRHNGRITVGRAGEDLVAVTIILPAEGE